MGVWGERKIEIEGNLEVWVGKGNGLSWEGEMWEGKGKGKIWILWGCLWVF